MQSNIFDIKRYAINDGPGIRVTIFYKGCPLNCVWCHNPEGISSEKQKLYTAEKCIGAARCIAVCPKNAMQLSPQGIITDQAKCKVCGLCAEVCPSKASEISGVPYQHDELMRVIERETTFFDHSGGGVTFSGGEPLMQHKALLDLLIRCGKKQIHRVVDTTLFAKWNLVEEVAKHTDLFLVDLKAMDNDVHLKFTGVPNILILENIKKLASLGADFLIRIPFIGGVNASGKELGKMADFLSKLPWERREVNLLPYHDVAKGKLERMGLKWEKHELKIPDENTVQRAIAIFESKKIKVIL